MMHPIQLKTENSDITNIMGKRAPFVGFSFGKPPLKS